MAYDSIGNITRKHQVNIGEYQAEGEEETDEHELRDTTYDFEYRYESTRPHAVTKIIDPNSEEDNTLYEFEYDGNGNMISMVRTIPGVEGEDGEVSEATTVRRTIKWDDENRMLSTSDNSTSTTYLYDDKGNRVYKSGNEGTVVYVNPNFTVRVHNGTVASKHIFAGNTRVCSKVTLDRADEAVYYYHGDHLGSSSVITDKAGTFYESLEYFPYGETWVQERASSESNAYLPYKFTGKELDPETGLYYFGHRYLDPKVSKWSSADRALNRYLPSPGVKNSELPGLGGIYNPKNLNLYNYAGNNPVFYTDPDGDVIVSAILIGMALYATVEGGYNMYKIHKLKGDRTTGTDYLVAGTFGVMTGSFEGAVTFGSAGVLAYPAAVLRVSLTDMMMQRMNDPVRKIDLGQTAQKAAVEASYKRLTAGLPVGSDNPVSNTIIKSIKKTVDKGIKSTINDTISGLRSGDLLSGKLNQSGFLNYQPSRQQILSCPILLSLSWMH